MNPDLKSRIEREVANGQAWRAKEILHSSFPQQFDPEICETYGRVLLQMNDVYEAGRYLFVSGARNPEYLSAIHIFIDRHLTMSIRGRYLTLPGRIHSVPIEAWPSAVLEDLRRVGSFEDIKKYAETHTPMRVRNRVLDRVISCGCFFFVAVLVILVFIGFETLLKLIW